MSGAHPGQLRRGFSLIEVVVAIAILGGASVGIVVLLASILATSRESVDAEVAMRVAASLEAMLRQTPLPTTPAPGRDWATWFATRDGARVELEGAGVMAARDRYFRIQVRFAAVGHPLAGPADDGAYLGYVATIGWPHIAPGEATAGAGTEVEGNRITTFGVYVR